MLLLQVPVLFSLQDLELCNPKLDTSSGWMLKYMYWI